MQYLVVCVYIVVTVVGLCAALRLRRSGRVGLRAPRLFTCWRVGRCRGYVARRFSRTCCGRHDVLVDGYKPDVDGYGPYVFCECYGPDVDGCGPHVSMTDIGLMFDIHC